MPYPSRHVAVNEGPEVAYHISVANSDNDASLVEVTPVTDEKHLARRIYREEFIF